MSPENHRSWHLTIVWCSLPGRATGMGSGAWYRASLTQDWASRGWACVCSLRRGRGTGPDVRRLARPDQKVTVIGDAAQAGKARDAVDGAFRAALLSE